jgi:hypothetical protein
MTLEPPGPWQETQFSRICVVWGMTGGAAL